MLEDIARSFFGLLDRRREAEALMKPFEGSRKAPRDLKEC